MKQITILAVAATSLLLGACAEDSKLPNPTGEGIVRALNAIPTSGDVNFLIEERAIGAATFKSITQPSVYDDLSYNFNFETVLPGSTRLTRVATVPLDVQADTDYTFVVAGNLASPDVSILEQAVREWGASDTVFEIRFAHLAPGLGDAFDVYFAPPGTPPVLGNEIDSLSAGEFSTPAEFEAAEMVLTLTAPDAPGTVIFESEAFTLTAANSYLVSAFNTTANDLGQVAVSVFNLNSGSGGPVPDVTIDPTLRFFHAARDFGIADIYIDEPPTTPLVMDHTFGDVSAEISVAPGDLAVTYTQADNVGMLLLEETVSLPRGSRLNVYVVRNNAGSDVLLVGAPNRRSIANQVTFLVTNTAADNPSLDLYLVPSGESIDDNLPVFAPLPTLFPLVRVALVANSYDLYLTVPDEKTVLFGPLAFEANLGDVFEIMIYDTVDPAAPDVVFIPPP